MSENVLATVDEILATIDVIGHDDGELKAMLHGACLEVKAAEAAFKKADEALSKLIAKRRQAFHALAISLSCEQCDSTAGESCYLVPGKPEIGKSEGVHLSRHQFATNAVRE